MDSPQVIVSYVIRTSEYISYEDILDRPILDSKGLL